MYRYRPIMALRPRPPMGMDRPQPVPGQQPPLLVHNVVPVKFMHPEGVIDEQAVVLVTPYVEPSPSIVVGEGECYNPYPPPMEEPMYYAQPKPTPMYFIASQVVRPPMGRPMIKQRTGNYQNCGGDDHWKNEYPMLDKSLKLVEVFCTKCGKREGHFPKDYTKNPANKVKAAINVVEVISSSSLEIELIVPVKIWESPKDAISTDDEWLDGMDLRITVKLKNHSINALVDIGSWMNAVSYSTYKRDEEEVKLRAFPLVLKDSAKNWFQNLEPGRKTNWETLKETFLSKYGGLDNPEHLWHRISSLHQATSRTYLTYESQFLRLWAECKASLAEGERAPNFLKKEKFLAGLFPDLQEKVKGKFPETFEEALQIARVKDRKLKYQAHTSRVEHPQGPTMADERLPPAPTTTPEDPYLELLQRVTNQLDNLSINMVQGMRQQQPQPNNERMPNGPRRQPQRRDYFCYNCGEEGHGMYFCPHPRNFNAQAGRRSQQVTPPRARPPPQIQPQILQNPQMVAQPQVLQRSVAPQPIAEIPPLPNNNDAEIDRRIHIGIYSHGLLNEEVMLGNALVDMYAK
ncbi:hypothetical protein L7F22_065135 [Adiantum nelumboides]|nr:hypothetical protein [Adiantum nelumboides]